MNYTANYHLPKPEQSDFYNVDDFHNSSMDILDMLLNVIENQLSSLTDLRIIGIVSAQADLPNPYAGSVGDIYLVRADETHDGKPTTYEYTGSGWSYLSDFGINVEVPTGIIVIPSTTGVNSYAAVSSDTAAYKTGAFYVITFTAANTGAATFNLNGWGDKPMRGDGGAALKAGEILAGSTHILVDTGTQFMTLSQRALLSAAQLATPLTGLVRNLASVSDITAADGLLAAFGKALSLASPITGYTVGSDAALAGADTLRAALGKLQGQVNGLKSRVPHLGTTAGNMPAYTAALTDARVPGLVAGSMYTVVFNAANNSDAAPSLNVTVNGLAQGAKALTDGNNVPLKRNAIAANSAHLLLYDGTRIKVMSQEAVLTAMQLATGLTGYAVGANAAVAASDTLLGAIGKLQAQSNARAPSSTTLAAPTADNTTPGVVSPAAAVTSLLQTIWNKLKYLFDKTVKTEGSQTIAGTKTFSTSPLVPTKTTAATNSGTVLATEAQVFANGNGYKSFQSGYLDFSETDMDGNDLEISISTISGADKSRTIIGFIPYDVTTYSDYLDQRIGNVYPNIKPKNGSSYSPFSNALDITSLVFDFAPDTYDAEEYTDLIGKWYAIVFN